MYRTFTDPELLRGLSYRSIVINNIVRYLDCPLFDISFHATLMMFVFILYASKRVRIPGGIGYRRNLSLRNRNPQLLPNQDQINVTDSVSLRDFLYRASVFPVQLPQGIAFLYGVQDLVRLPKCNLS